ncbi:MAG: CBS domain-containing protein [Candidatus Eremiobacterota bacterium]
MKTARDVMTRDVVTVNPTTPIHEVAKLLSSRMITGVPVTDPNGTVLGVVSVSDLARRADSGPGADFYQKADGGRMRARRRSTPVGEVMTRLVVEVDQNADLKKVMDLMLNFRIHRVLVTRDRKVVGVISALDLIRELRGRMET